jgi:glutamine cyclotransferase
MPSAFQHSISRKPDASGTTFYPAGRGRTIHRLTGIFRITGPVFGGLALLALSCTLAAGCGKKVQPKSGAENRVSAVQAARVSGTRVAEPANNSQFSLGEKIPLRLERVTDTLPGIDSVQFFAGGDRQHTLHGEPFAYEWSTENLRVGTWPLRLICYYADGRKEYHDLSIVILSDITPRYLKYRLLNTWPHDPKAYTQGLVYDDGFLYEGTGQWTESSLRKTEIRTGEPVRMLNLPDDIFGEGITLLNDRIYQLTYKSQVGFVYEKETFRRIQKVYYEIEEGWGLTHNGQYLIMSDGTNRIYYMDPEYFTEVRQLEVYDDRGPVSRLNELEYIEGRIFANIYGEEEIVIIDPETGKITAKINMKGILPAKDRSRKIDVFNGIAWDPAKRILYVTGKYWPKMFEVSLEGEF